jgi:hypothetical protein
LTDCAAVGHAVHADLQARPNRAWSPYGDLP